MKKLLFITMIFVFVFGWGAVPAKAAPPQPFYLVKECIMGEEGEHTVCEISSATLEVLNGGTITYFDHAFFFPNRGGIAHEASTILVIAAEGSTANGHISWVLIKGEFSGHYTILPGTGSLAGLHASGRVAVMDWSTLRFSFTGTYFVAP